MSKTLAMIEKDNTFRLDLMQYCHLLLSLCMGRGDTFFFGLFGFFFCFLFLTFRLDLMQYCQLLLSLWMGRGDTFFFG